MVMELLGKSLEDMLQNCPKRKLQVKTAVLLGRQVLHRIEYLHSKCIIHRDIKPENFTLGIGGKAHHVYLIDFGLSKRYWDKAHITWRSKLSLTGTARYASIHAHKGHEQSRRDDLEAIGHMLLYFLRGVLPWSGLDAKTKQDKYRKIMEKKEKTPLSELCKDFPNAFEKYLTYTRELAFQERPDYDFCQSLFAEVLQDLQTAAGNEIQDWEYEWASKPETSEMVPLHPRTRLMQPDDPEERRVTAPKRRWCFCGSVKNVRD
jgi:serine/threonine protein kinase